MGCCTSLQGVTVHLHDLKGKDEVVRMKTHSTIADFSQKHLPEGFEGHLLIDGGQFPTDCTQELRKKADITFIPTLKLNLTLSNGQRYPLLVPANCKIADLMKNYPSFVGPGSTLCYQDQHLIEDRTIAEQDVASNAEILVRSVNAPVPAPPLMMPQLGFLAPSQPYSRVGPPVAAPQVVSNSQIKLELISPVSTPSQPSEWQVGGLLQSLGLPYARFDSVGDRNFINTPPSNRGGQAYYPPNGWKRYGLKVKGLFENDIWLGKTNGAGEWLVSCHGTSIANANGIIMRGYDRALVRRGGGIYSAQNIAVAQGYCQAFNYQRRAFLVILMNRVNPVISPAATGNNIYVATVSQYIRPYGLLIKAC